MDTPGIGLNQTLSAYATFLNWLQIQLLTVFTHQRLDEATSVLDTETERAIQLSLAELSRGRTTLVIAHRLTTVRDADRIVAVDETGIAEQGRHGALLAAGGAYRRLHDAQLGAQLGMAA